MSERRGTVPPYVISPINRYQNIKLLFDKHHINNCWKLKLSTYAKLVGKTWWKTGYLHIVSKYLSTSYLLITKENSNFTKNPGWHLSQEVKVNSDIRPDMIHWEGHIASVDSCQKLIY